MVKYLYRPEDRYVAYKRHTLQHAKPGDELRVLACIHEQDNVTTALTLLQASGHSHDSPIYVYVLHLHHLIGLTDAVLHPHKRHNEPSSSATALSESDHIVNAFQQFEQQHSDGVWVLPYICISPYNTMHDDVCSLALDKKVTLVILPFHKNVKADGSIIFVNPAVQSVNVNVLRYTPCSVAILVDHGISDCGKLLQHVAVYFLGGADDREALAYGSRMAKRAAIRLTVPQPLPPPLRHHRGQKATYALLSSRTCSSSSRLEQSNRWHPSPSTPLLLLCYYFTRLCPLLPDLISGSVPSSRQPDRCPFFLPCCCIVRCHRSQPLPRSRDPLPLLDSTLPHLPIASSTNKQQQTRGLSTSSGNDLADDAVQLRLMASSLLPLLVKLAKVPDRGRALDAGTAPVLPSRIGVNRLRGLANAATKALCLPASSSTSPAERTVVRGGHPRQHTASTASFLHRCPAAPATQPRRRCPLP
ncbi:hypothetical protein BHM03_00058085 [Ensete ventricosum]|nr:hypothetical protein BHM03_00058085 [Ensete ventricosum]